MAQTVGRLKPQLGRQARAALVMDQRRLHVHPAADPVLAEGPSGTARLRALRGKNVAVDSSLQDVLEHALGAAVTRSRPVSGGDVARSYAVDLDDGRRVFAKTHPAAPAHFFTTEAAGLVVAARSRSVAVPEVLAVSDEQPNQLVLEWIDEGRARHGDRAGAGRRTRPAAPRRRAELRA